MVVSLFRAMNITESQIQKTVEQRLNDAGMFAALNGEFSQFLSFPEGAFVEIVLNDAGRISDVEEILRGYKEELLREGIELDAIIRAVWKVTAVNFVGLARSAEGGLLSAAEFEAFLIAGRKQCRVTVNVSVAAEELLQRQLAGRNSRSTSRLPWDARKELLCTAVKKFLEIQLHNGGESYWDPIRHPHLDINEAAMLFLVGQSATFRELIDAINSAFSAPILPNFSRSLETEDIRIRNFDQVLPHLSSLLAGPFARGQNFSTSAPEMFSRLREIEQQLMRQYYAQKVEIADPAVKNEFKRLFA